MEPGWSIWTSPVPEGESVDQVGARARPRHRPGSRCGRGRRALQPRPPAPDPRRLLDRSASERRPPLRSRHRLRQRSRLGARNPGHPVLEPSRPPCPRKQDVRGTMGRAWIRLSGKADPRSGPRRGGPSRADSRSGRRTPSRQAARRGQGRELLRTLEVLALEADHVRVERPVGLGRHVRVAEPDAARPGIDQVAEGQPAPVARLDGHHRLGAAVEEEAGRRVAEAPRVLDVEARRAARSAARSRGPWPRCRSRCRGRRGSADTRSLRRRASSRSASRTLP